MNCVSHTIQHLGLDLVLMQEKVEEQTGGEMLGLPMYHFPTFQIPELKKCLNLN